MCLHEKKQAKANKLFLISHQLLTFHQVIPIQHYGFMYCNYNARKSQLTAFWVLQPNIIDSLCCTCFVATYLKSVDWWVSIHCSMYTNNKCLSSMYVCVSRCIKGAQLSVIVNIKWHTLIPACHVWLDLCTWIEGLTECCNKLKQKICLQEFDICLLSRN